MQITALERELINGWQKNFPLTSRPYAQIGAECGISERQVIDTLASLTERGALSRVGAVVRPNTVGTSSLVAMAIPPCKLKEIAQIVCEEPAVNHNYEREDEINLWFVVTASCGRELDEILLRIEKASGYSTLKLPLEKAFHIDLGFSI